MAFTWLHLSDFHLSPSSPYDSDVVLKALVESVAWFRQQGNWQPDLIFATGDIAEKGAAAVFTGTEPRATTFFNALLKAADLSRERLFIVPGNHDVQREKGDFLLSPLNSQAQADKYFHPDNPKHHFAKLEYFISWYNAYFSGIRTFPVNSTCELIDIGINGHQLAILSLNSALFCMDSKTDHRQLLVGRRCLFPVIEQLKSTPHDLSIALVHHPLDWLSPVEQKQIKGALKSQVNFLLQGHNHETEIEQSAKTFIQLAAGAAYKTERCPKRALYGRFENEQVMVFPISYAEGSDTPVWTVDTSVFPHAKGHVKKYSIRSKTMLRGTSAARRLLSSAKESDAALLCYQAALKEELGWIRMLGLPDVERVDVNLSDDTFVPLRFSRRRGEAKLSGDKVVPLEHDSEKVLAPDEVMQQAFTGHRMLLVIGDPGAGKTTLLKYYALCALDGQRCTRLGFSSPVNVFYLPLRDLVRSGDGSYDTLSVNLSRWAKKQHRTIDAALFEGWLNGEKSLVLLDGLDEISDREERKKVCRWIEGACRGFAKAFFVVTSRGTGYRKAEGMELEVDYERADVEDFTLDQQERFLTNWFRAAFLREHGDGEDWQSKQLAKADEKTVKIVAHLKEEKNRGLRQLAAIPMILQIMAILWKDRDHLPKSRVKLYRAVLDYLLEFRDERRGIRPLLSAEEARIVLGPVSLWMQEKLRKDEVDRSVLQEKMKERLDILDNPPNVVDFCDYLVKRADLLVEYGSREYVFRHKSFREYLAGVELVKKVNRTSGYLEVLIAGFVEDWWDEPIRFFIAQGDEESFNLFMERLFDSSLSDDLLQKKHGLLLTLIEEAPVKKVDALCKKLRDPKNTAFRQRVVLDCLKAIGKSSAIETLEWFKNEAMAKNPDVAKRTEEVLLALGDESGGKASIVTATSRKVNLDNRPSSFRNPNEHNAEYILIPAGRYRYSVEKKKVSVPDLYVAKYPVTNKLYRSFIAYLQSPSSEVEAVLSHSLFRESLHHIAEQSTWDAGFAGYLEQGKEDLAALFRSERDEDRKFGGDDQPVVSITWYAARAYSLWLSLLEGGKDGLYRIPTEEEWEYAASGKESRKYPWGDPEPSAQLANYNEMVGATTPVSSYPDGATSEGLYDMAGNVWEWMENLYDKNTSDSYFKSARALRGGSWLNYPVYLRCSARGSYSPGLTSNDLGFRVVRSSHS